MKKVLLILSLIILAFAGYVWFFVYNKPHKDIEAAQTDIVTTENDISKAFEEDASASNTTYNNKVVELTGTVSEIIKDDSLSSIVFNGSENYTITCEVLPSYNDQALQLSAGEKIRIKGLYIGFLEVDQDFGIPGDIKMKKGSFEKL